MLPFKLPPEKKQAPASFPNENAPPAKMQTKLSAFFLPKNNEAVAASFNGDEKEASRKPDDDGSVANGDDDDILVIDHNENDQPNDQSLSQDLSQDSSVELVCITNPTRQKSLWQRNKEEARGLQDANHDLIRQMKTPRWTGFEKGKICLVTLCELLNIPEKDLMALDFFNYADLNDKSSEGGLYMLPAEFQRWNYRDILNGDARRIKKIQRSAFNPWKHQNRIKLYCMITKNKFHEQCRRWVFHVSKKFNCGKAKWEPTKIVDDLPHLSTNVIEISDVDEKSLVEIPDPEKQDVVIDEQNLVQTQDSDDDRKPAAIPAPALQTPEAPTDLLEPPTIVVAARPIVAVGSPVAASIPYARFTPSPAKKSRTSVLGLSKQKVSNTISSRESVALAVGPRSFERMTPKQRKEAEIDLHAGQVADDMNKLETAEHEHALKLASSEMGQVPPTPDRCPNDPVTGETNPHRNREGPGFLNCGSGGRGNYHPEPPTADNCDTPLVSQTLEIDTPPEAYEMHIVDKGVIPVRRHAKNPSVHYHASDYANYSPMEDKAKGD